MSNWTIAASGVLQSVYDVMKDELLNRSYIQADETTVKVIEDNGKDSKSKKYMWLYKSGASKDPIILYDYQKTRSSSCPREFLQGFSGFLQTDGYSGYNKVENIKRLYCLAQIRLQKTAPLLDEFQEYVEKEIPNALPKSLLGKALDCTKKLLPDMKTLLLDGSLEIDNNGAERAIKPFVIGRKNWLFSNTAKGAKASASIYSIIETAKANELIVEKYLVYLLSMLSNVDSKDKDRMLQIMPWSKDIPVELRVSRRK